MSIIHTDPDGPTGKLIAAYSELQRENAALRASKEKAEAALCRAREWIKAVPAYRIDFRLACDDLERILSSRAPCPHGAEVERLDRSLSDACKLLDSALGEGPECDCPPEGHICGWLKWKNDTRTLLDAELSRRASDKEP